MGAVSRTGRAARLSVPIMLALAVLLWGADGEAASFMLSGVLCALGAISLALAGPVMVAPGRALAVAASAVAVALLAGFSQRHGLDLHPEYAVLAAAVAVFVVGRVTALRGEAAMAWTCYRGWILVYALWAVLSARADPRMSDDAARLSSSFLSANTAATWLGMTGLAALSALARRARGREALWAWATLPTAFVALLSTGSRAGAGLFLLVALIVAVSAWRKARAAGPAFLLLVAGALVAAGLVGGGIWNRMRVRSLLSGLDIRSEMFGAWWRAARSDPVAGHGLGEFARAANAQMNADNALLLAEQGAAHNVVLQWLVQAGWLGTLGMAAVTALILRDIATRRRAGGGIADTVLAVSLFVILHGAVDYALEIPAIVWWWAWMLGLAHGLGDPRPGAGRAAAAPPVTGPCRRQFCHGASRSLYDPI